DPGGRGWGGRPRRGARDGGGGAGGRGARARAGADQRPPVSAAHPVSRLVARVAGGDEQHGAGELDGDDGNARIDDRNRRAAGADGGPPREPAAAGGRE